MDKSKLTAMARTKPSKPLQGLLSNPVLLNSPILDFGCGRGMDVDTLNYGGFPAIGYDPNNPVYTAFPRGTFPTVLMFYVLNVLRPVDRSVVLRRAWSHVKPGGRLIIATRPISCVSQHARRAECDGKPWKACSDGFLTGTGTFQCGLDYAQLSYLIKGLPNLWDSYRFPPQKFGKACACVIKAPR